jgi:hypothetical protein
MKYLEKYNSYKPVEGFDEYDSYLILLSSSILDYFKKTLPKVQFEMQKEHNDFNNTNHYRITLFYGNEMPIIKFWKSKIEKKDLINIRLYPRFSSEVSNSVSYEFLLSVLEKLQSNKTLRYNQYFIYNPNQEIREIINSLKIEEFELFKDTKNYNL